MPSLAPPPDLRLVRTDIAGFVGFAERGPLIPPGASPEKIADYVPKLTSWKDFRLFFGGLLADAYLAYAVRGFFATGGTTCYVARIGSAVSPPIAASLPLPQARQPQLVTYLAGLVMRGQSKVTLESSDAVSLGQTIVIGESTGAESFMVSEILDDQTIGVRPAPQALRQKEDPVYKVSGTALVAASNAGQSELRVADTKIFEIGGQNAVYLVSVEGGGLREFRVVSGVVPGSTVRLGRPLDFDYAAGSIVREYESALTVEAKYVGEWGNRIRLRFTPLQAGTAVTEFALHVSVDASDDRGQPIQEEFYPHLSLDSKTKGAPVPVYAPDVVQDHSQLIKLSLNPLADGEKAALQFGIGALEANDGFLEGGSDGVARGEISSQDFFRALDALGLIDEVAILCCPDAVGTPTLPPIVLPPPPPGPCDSPKMAGSVAANVRVSAAPKGKWSLREVQAAMLEQCLRLRYRVAILDTPVSQQPSEIRNWLDGQAFDRDEARFGAVYYPWLKVPDELEVDGPNRLVPPSGHIAGAYAFTDINFGVQKPPANVELQFVNDLEIELSDGQQGPLNERGINAIRVFPGRGIRVWGARSASLESEWRFIHTRRLLSMIEDSVESSSRWTVYEPNDQNLRRMLTHALNIFLEGLWLSGGLKGARPDQGYFVKCDETNNPQSSIDAGFLVCQVGVAIAAPMEFITFELRRSVAGPQVVEA